MILSGRTEGHGSRCARAVSALALALGVVADGGAWAGDGPPPAHDLKAAAEAPAAGGPRADAGDDQYGLVGHRITLNAVRSTPREATFRWILLSGPRVDRPSQDGSYYSFTPSVPGTYRLGLVVASCRGGVAVISELDEVTVTVGEVPSGVVGGGAPSLTMAAIEQMLQGPGAVAGRAALEQTAGAFESVSARVPLYTSFSDLSAELMRRLDVVIPTDPNWRRFWTEAVFAPLTQHVVAEMQQTGLDLRGPQGQSQPLGQAQQEHLQKLLTSYAREFRSRARR